MLGPIEAIECVWQSTQTAEMRFFSMEKVKAIDSISPQLHTRFNRSPTGQAEKLCERDLQS